MQYNCVEDLCLDEEDEGCSLERTVNHWEDLSMADLEDSQVFQGRRKPVKYQTPEAQEPAPGGALHYCCQAWERNANMLPGFQVKHALPYLMEDSERHCICSTRVNKQGHMTWMLGFLPFGVICDPKKKYQKASSFKRMAFHRISWMLHYGRYLKPGEYLAHTCGVKACVNPLHLRLVDCNHPGADLDRRRDSRLSMKLGYRVSKRSKT